MLRFEMDKAAWYSVIRWIVKWSIVMAVLMLFWTYMLDDERAKEARLVRMEQRLDSLDSLSLLPLPVYLDSTDGEIYATPQRPWLVPVQLTQHEDTLLSVFGRHLVGRSTP